MVPDSSGSPAYRVMGLTCHVSEALDPELWKRRYAWGINLGGTTDLAAAVRRCGGDADAFERLINEIPPDVIRWHLRAAMSDLEVRLGIPMGVVRYLGDPPDAGERLGQTYDAVHARQAYTMSNAAQYLRIDLPPGVIRVDRVRAFVWGTSVWSWSASDDDLLGDIRLEHAKQGVIHIIPRAFNRAVQAGNSLAFGYLSRMMSMPGPIPDFWSVDFTIGPWAHYEGNLRPGQIEVVLADWIAVKAGVKLLSMGGLAKSGGVASTSLSIDGISKSISTTSSAIYGLNSAFEKVLQDHEKSIDWRRLRLYKNPPRISILTTTTA